MDIELASHAVHLDLIDASGVELVADFGIAVFDFFSESRIVFDFFDKPRIIVLYESGIVEALFYVL